MMELIEDVFIHCGRCGKVTGIHKADFKFESYKYDRCDNMASEEIEFRHDGYIECNHCGIEISFRISGYEYPVGAFNYEDCAIAGGRFEEEPHMGIIYIAEMILTPMMHTPRLHGWSKLLWTSPKTVS